MLSIVRVLPLLAVLLAAPSAMAQDAAFPITLEHALGTVTIPAEPQRVVALIDRDADTVLALGVQPVGIRSNYNFDAGVGPWAEPLLTTEPAVWKGRELNFEAIAAADPDLIVFATSGGDAAEYERLSQIAPTIALPRGANPWEATTAQTTLPDRRSPRPQTGRRTTDRRSRCLPGHAEGGPSRICRQDGQLSRHLSGRHFQLFRQSHRQRHALCHRLLAHCRRA